VNFLFLFPATKRRTAFSTIYRNPINTKVRLKEGADQPHTYQFLSKQLELNSGNKKSKTLKAQKKRANQSFSIVETSYYF